METISGLTRRCALVMPILSLLIFDFIFVDAFLLGKTTTTNLKRINKQNHQLLNIALGDFSVELEKPLGIILEEREIGGGGVKVKELVEDGAAATFSQIVPGDVLLEVGNTDVSKYGFDSVMELLVQSESPVQLKLGDGLGVMDMPKNVVKGLKTTEEAFFVDAVVRQAVREIRKNGRLGDLINVEVIVGAAVKDQGTRGLVRFFAIFSTDGVSTYSCNVSATGVTKSEEEDINIVSLSCAKDEGLGQTYDLI